MNTFVCNQAEVEGHYHSVIPRDIKPTDMIKMIVEKDQADKYIARIYPKVPCKAFGV